MQEILSDKRIFTTGDIAKIFEVNINTVVKWFEEGLLKGYKLPNSTARRVPRAELIEFMVNREVPVVGGPGEAVDMILLSPRLVVGDKFNKAVKNAFGYNLRTAMDSFEAGFLCAERVPDVIIVDREHTDFDTVQFRESMKDRPQFTQTKLLLLADAALKRDLLKELEYNGQVKPSSRGNTLLDAVDKVVLKKCLDIPRFTLTGD